MVTTGIGNFAECRQHLAMGGKHPAMRLSSVTLKCHLAIGLTGKAMFVECFVMEPSVPRIHTLPRVKYWTLGKAWSSPARHVSPFADYPFSDTRHIFAEI